VDNSMPFNGTDWINQPWNTTFKPFTDLFEPFGEAFYLIPITFIGVALYMKTRNPTVVSAYLIAVGVLMTGGGILNKNRSPLVNKIPSSVSTGVTPSNTIVV